MQLPNSIETALVYQAAAALGCVILPIVTIYGPHELGFVLRDARAKILFIPNRWRQTDCVQTVRDSGQLPDLKRSEEHTSELQSLMRNSYAVFCLNKKIKQTSNQ